MGADSFLADWTFANSFFSVFWSDGSVGSDSDAVLSLTPWSQLRRLLQGAVWILFSLELGVCWASAGVGGESKLSASFCPSVVPEQACKASSSGVSNHRARIKRHQDG